jgi:hypothetical protein
MLRKRLAAIGMSSRTARTAALFQLAVELPAAMLARCLGIDISNAVAWQRAAAGDWHPYAARTAAHCQSHKRSIHWLIRDRNRARTAATCVHLILQLRQPLRRGAWRRRRACRRFHVSRRAARRGVPGLALAGLAVPALRRMRRESGIRGRGLPVYVTLKTWKLLTKSRCRLAATAVVQAIAVLHQVVNPIFGG